MPLWRSISSPASVGCEDARPNRVARMARMLRRRAPTAKRCLSAILVCVQASTSPAHTDTAELARDLGLFLKRVVFANNRQFFGAVQEAGISFIQLKCLGLLV